MKSIEIQNQIITEYKKGIPLKTIAEKYKIHRGTIRNYINKANVTHRKTKITDSLINKMFIYYKQGFTNKEIADKLNLEQAAIARYLQQYYNVNDSPATRRQRIKHNPFKDLSKDSVQYWLGYLCADGNIKKSSNEIRLITSLDIDYLKKYYTQFIHETNDTLVINKPLSMYEYYDKRYNSTCLTISFSNKKVKDYLIALGITPNKSLTLNINFNISFAFLRGLLDGDGTVCQRGRSCSWVSASPKFIQSISDFLTTKNIKHSISKSKSVFCIRVSSINLKYLYIEMYKDAIYYLERKKSKFKV